MFWFVLADRINHQKETYLLNDVIELTMCLYPIRVGINTSQENIAASTDAAAPILVSTEGYVRRFVTRTAPGLTAPVLTYTMVICVKRLNIQETAKTSLRAAPRHQKSTTSLIQPMNRFPFTVTCNQNLALYGL